MKIAFLSTFYPYRGGIAQFNASLYRTLEEEYTIQAFNFSLQYPKLFFPGKTQYVSATDEADKIPTKRILNSINPASYRKTAKEILEYDPDVLIIGYWLPFMAPALGFVAGMLRKKCKVVAIIHNVSPHEKSVTDRKLNGYFFNRVDQFVALSKSVKKDLLTYKLEKPIEVIPHPLYEHFGKTLSKEEAAFNLDLPKEKKYLLFFGLIRKYKGLDVLLRAMSKLPNDIHLLVAGEAYENMENYQKIIEKEKVGHRIHLFDDYIPDHEVGSFFSLADYCVLPYITATQSGVTAIAHYFNVPVIATKVGGLEEFINNNKNGILIDKPDEKLLAAAIKMSYDKDLLSTFREELARKKHFTWKDFRRAFTCLIN